MKVKEFIRHLKKYDENKEIMIYELSDLYDSVLLAIDDDDDHVILNIKNYPKDNNKDGELH